MPSVLIQCQWVYRTFEDVEELERDAGEKEESAFRPYPVENGSDHEENGTNGTGETLSDPLEWCILCLSLVLVIIKSVF